MQHPTDRIAHTMAFVTPVVGHWLEREIAAKQRVMKQLIKAVVFTLFYDKTNTPFITGKSVHSWCDGSSDRFFIVDPLSYFSF